MKKCRDDASKSGKMADVMKKEVKGLAAKPLAKQMSALEKYKKAALKQKDIASKGATDAKAAIAAAKKDAAGPVRGIHALKATKGGKRKRMTKRKRKKRSQRAALLADAARLPEGEADLSLPRTDLSHFRPEAEFDALPHDDFVRIQDLGQGFMGTVQQYRWRKPEGDIQVAVKKIPREQLGKIALTETDERASHFRLSSKPRAPVEDSLSEIGVLSYLAGLDGCPRGLLRLLGVFSEDRANVWVVTELAEAGELFGHVVSGSVGGEVQARRYTREMLDAVAYLHRHRIGHRDLSLENMLLTADGTLQVMDFGMSVLSHSASGTALRYFRRVGKDGYRAPECYVPEVEEVHIVCPAGGLPGEIRMERLAGAWHSHLAVVRLPAGAQPGKPCRAAVCGYAAQPNDVFAVGVCSFVLCYGVPPFVRATLEDANYNWFHKLDRDGLSRLVRGWGLEPCSPVATSLQMRMLSVDPARRPSAAKCLEDGWLAPDEAQETSRRLAHLGA
jgi:serine/threonine protein kinase